MPFPARCPYCKKRILAPDKAMGASAKCPGCGAWYTVAPDDTPDPPPSAPSSPIEPRAPKAEAPAEPKREPAPAEPPAAPTVVPLTVASAGAAPSDASGDTFGALALGVLVCFAALAVVVFANLQATTGLVRPLAVGVCVFGLAVAGTAGGTRSMAIALGGVGLSALALALALFAPSALGPTYERSREKPDPNADALRAIPRQFGPEAGALPDPASHVDASTFALQQGFARVTIVEASVGPVQLVDSKRRFTKEHYLTLSVRVQHLGHGAPFQFSHWGGRGAQVVPPATATAQGRKLAPAQFGRDVPLGVTAGSEVPAGQNVGDLLLFEAPDPNAPVRVELPAEAWGGTGVFKFEVPVSMIARAAPPKPR